MLSAVSRAEEVHSATCEVVRGRLLVSASINGDGPYPFLLDAGLRQPVLTPEAVAYFGFTPGQMPDYPGVSVIEVDAFAPAALPPQPAILLVSPLPGLPERLGYRVAGLVPLHQPGYEIEIDVTNGAVRWRGLADAALDKTVATAIPMRLADTGQPQVQALLNGEYLTPVQIDLNFGDTLSLPAGLIPEVTAGDTPRLRTRLDGGGIQEQCRLHSITIGNAELRNPLCTIAPDGAPARIGLAFLRHFKATLNLEYGRLHLEAEGTEAPADPPVEGYGLALARQQGGLWTMHVAEGSPAAEAGLLPGDQLAAIGGQSMADVGYEGVLRLLDAPAGAGVALTWRRGAQEQTRELVARPLL